MMEVVNFFFNDFWHFVMLLLVCYALSPKIDIKQNTPVNLGEENKKNDVC